MPSARSQATRAPARSLNAGRSGWLRSSAKTQRGLKAQPGSGQQHPCVGVAGADEQVFGRRLFHQATQIQHADPVRHMAQDRQVIADEHLGQAQFVARIAHQIENLRLHQDIEG